MLVAMMPQTGIDLNNYTRLKLAFNLDSLERVREQKIKNNIKKYLKGQIQNIKGSGIHNKIFLYNSVLNDLVPDKFIQL